jgi:hypothetical protein
MGSGAKESHMKLGEAGGAFRFRIPLWVVLVLLGAFTTTYYAVVSLSSNGTDSDARRWHRSDPIRESSLYQTLVDPTPNNLFSEPKDPPSFNWRVPNVVVYSAPAVSPPHSHLSIRGLSDNAQAHVIDFLAKEIPLAPDAWTKLEEALIDEPHPRTGSDNDPFKFQRILVATVSKGTDWGPGDRFLWTRVLIAPINFRFAGYTVASTENAIVRVTTVETTRTRKSGGGLELEIPGLENAKATVEPPNNERTIKTSSDVESQYEKLGVDIFPNFLRLIRESERGGDVVGNTSIALSMVTDPVMIRKRTFQDDPSPPDPQDLELLVTATHFDEDSPTEPHSNESLISVQPRVPVPHCPLRALVWMIYETRHITNGREFYEEAKQDVELIRDAKDKQYMEVVDADDVSPALWSIKIVRNDQPETSKPEFLSAHAEEKSLPRVLVFTEYGSASKVVRWLKAGNPQDPRNKLNLEYPGAPQKVPDNVSLIPVKRIFDECNPKYRPEYKGSYKPLAGQN